MCQDKISLWPRTASSEISAHMRHMAAMRSLQREKRVQKLPLQHARPQKILFKLDPPPLL